MVQQGAPDWPDGAVGADGTLYRDNAFRVAALPVTATPRQVRRRAERLRAAEALGAEEPLAPGVLPPSPPPGHAEVREALRRLEDPLIRLSDEFLWLWPLPGDEKHPETAPETEADPDAAPGRWRALAAGPPGAPGRSAAVHNLAVFSHAKAVEHTPAEHAGLLADRWATSYAYWGRVLADDDCWGWLDQRIRVLDDPRLRGWSGERLRRALPALLLAAHARAVVAWATEGADPHRHIALMREFDPVGGADPALRRAVDPLATRVRRRYERERERTADEPAAHDLAAAALLTETDDDLRVLGAVLGQGHPLSQDSADAVASAVHQHAVRCANQSADAEPAVRGPHLDHSIEHLRRARKLAASGHVRTPIDRDLAVLISNVIGLACAEAADRGERFPSRGAGYARALIRAAGPRLRLLDELPGVPVEGLDHSELADSVAAVACILLIGFQRATGEREATCEGLRAALPYARTGRTREAIERQLAALDRTRHAPPGPYEDNSVRIPGTAEGIRCSVCDQLVPDDQVEIVYRRGEYGGAFACCPVCRALYFDRSSVPWGRPRKVTFGCAGVCGGLLIALGLGCYVVAYLMPDARNMWIGIGLAVLACGFALRRRAW
ncbi:hypothetical protein AAHZ94_19900 [Streptomyces sp. HSW2009]|uniref:hypothetical protein n=1 Tax=Streptomyces sp. HSW2009 TaxID=3142890 RepID=UPI0032EFE9C9